MIKYFCDDCGRQMEIDAHPLDVEEGGEGVDIFYHDLGTETHSYDKRSDERTQHHQCKLCHIKEFEEESFYYDDILEKETNTQWDLAEKWIEEGA